MRVYHESTARNLLERYFICTTYVIHFFLWLDSHMYGRDGNVLIVILNISRTNDIFIDSSSHEFSFWPILRFQHDCCRLMHDVHVCILIFLLAFHSPEILWLMLCLFVCILWHTLLYHARHPLRLIFWWFGQSEGVYRKNRQGLTRLLFRWVYHCCGRPAFPRLSEFLARVSTSRRASFSSVFLLLAWPDPRRGRLPPRPASSRGGVCNVRNRGPNLNMAPRENHYNLLKLTIEIKCVSTFQCWLFELLLLYP